MAGEGGQVLSAVVFVFILAALATFAHHARESYAGFNYSNYSLYPYSPSEVYLYRKYFLGGKRFN